MTITICQLAKWATVEIIVTHFLSQSFYLLLPPATMRQKMLISKWLYLGYICICISIFYTIGFLSILSAIIIYLPDEVTSFQRCPEHGSTDFPTINYYPDEKFCNIYHKCNCTRAECHAVESRVCPFAKVYSRTEETCLGSSLKFSFLKRIYISTDVEEESCQTTYVQWVQTHSNDGKTALMTSDSLLPSISNKDFECVEDQPGKFRWEISRSLFDKSFFL
jgi:hypothetical protein